MFATLVLLFVVTVQTYTLLDKIVSTYADNLQTVELRLPIWPFFARGLARRRLCRLLIAVRTYRLIFHPELMPQRHQIKPIE